MTLPVQITYRNLQPSPAVTARVHSEVAKLDRYFSRITSCRVMIEAPHRHHKWGELFHIRLELGVPGAELVVKHEPSAHSALANEAGAKWTKHLETNPRHKDIYIAIHDAFKEARRSLADYVRTLRGDVKLHSRIPLPRASKLAENAL